LIPSELSRAPGEGKETLEIVLMIVTVLWSIHFSVLGWLIYAQKRDWPHRIISRVAWLYKLISSCRYVDKLYEYAFAKPILWFSDKILWKTVDKTVVDGIVVEGAARSVGLMATLAQAAQTGVLQQYLLYFLIGAVVVVGYLAL